MEVGVADCPTLFLAGSEPLLVVRSVSGEALTRAGGWMKLILGASVLVEEVAEGTGVQGMTGDSSNRSYVTE